MTDEKSPMDDPHGVDPDPDAPEFPDAEPSIDGVMAEIARQLGGGDGWPGIDTPAGAMLAQRGEMSSRAKREANVFRDTFATPAGRQCLELMLDMTLRKRAYPAELNLPIDAITPLVIAHDANCNFVFAILAAIAQADNRSIEPRD